MLNPLKVTKLLELSLNGVNMMKVCEKQKPGGDINLRAQQLQQSNSARKSCYRARKKRHPVPDSHLVGLQAPRRAVAAVGDEVLTVVP